MSKYDRENARAVELTQLFRTMIQSHEFWEGYYNKRHASNRRALEGEVAPRLAAKSFVTFNPRNKQKWVIALDDGREIMRADTEEELGRAFAPENAASTGPAMGDFIINAADKNDINDYMVSALHARIIASYGPMSRAWIATGYDEYKTSPSKAYYECVSRDKYGLHDLNQMSLHFYNGILSLSYHWSPDLWLSGYEFCTRGQCPQIVIEGAPGQRVDAFFDVPFVGDAIVNRAYNYSGTWQLTYHDEMKSLREWIELGLL